MRTLAVLGLVIGLAAGADAAVRAGYKTLPGKIAWVENFDSAQRNKTEGYSQGMAAFAVDFMRDLNGCWTWGGSFGIGLPVSEVEFDRTKEYLTEYINKNEGDSVTAAMTTVPLMARLAYGKSLGPGNFTLSLGAGAILAGIQMESADVWWWTGMAPGPDKFPSSATKAFTRTAKSLEFAAVPAIEIVPGYGIAISEKDSLGVEFPLGLLKRTVINSNEMDYEPVIQDPLDSDPLVGGDVDYFGASYPSFEIGGFSWGVNIVYMRKF